MVAVPLAVCVALQRPISCHATPGATFFGAPQVLLRPYYTRIEGPLILYDAEDGKLAPNERGQRRTSDGNITAPLDRPILGVARLADPNDK